MNADRYFDLLYNIGNRTWFSQEHADHTQTAFRGVRAALTHERVEYLQVLYGALTELYHLDRALHAASLVQLGEPRRNTDITAIGNDYLYMWPLGAFSTLPAIVTLLENEMPDQLLGVGSTGNPATPHREIYAEYGSMFCVKVAEV
jgi:hypothetical protein